MTLTTEHPRHIHAFEIYLSHGPKRTYERVAVALGVSVSSVKLWSRSFRWRQRIAERDASAARQIADKNLQSSIDENTRDKKIVTMALMKVAKAIAEEEVPIRMADLDRLIRLNQILSGTEAADTRGERVFRSQEDVEKYLETLSSAQLQLLIRAPDIERALKSVPPDSSNRPSTR